MGNNPYRDLPSVNEVLQTFVGIAPGVAFPQDTIVEAIRAELQLLRARIAEGEIPDGELDMGAIAKRVASQLRQAAQPKLRSVINATGIILHTNLGRAPLAEEAARAAYEAGRGYLNLEMDLESGKRSSRQLAIRAWVCRLTGAESATAVNNNAAATVIALRALCQGKDVIISRGQLIEIGGSFRIPEIMAVSGARLHEVGTTNITRLSDYERALSPQTGALLRVHPSNYRISGFTQAVPLTDLVALGREKGVPVIDDIGSGAQLDFEQFGLQCEPVARDSIAAGADLVLFSGDKLLGGPQAGILAGRCEYIDMIEADPLMRAFRLDKMTLAALEATLKLYVAMGQQDAPGPHASVPVLRMISTPAELLKERAKSLADRLRSLSGLGEIQVRQDLAFAGGGSLPDQSLQTWVVAFRARALSDAELARRLRLGSPAVVARVQDGMLLLDLRTVFQEQHEELARAVDRALATP
jgi:L-seryl-tRNA(Ser) seleniumtransferase